MPPSSSEKCLGTNFSLRGFAGLRFLLPIFLSIWISSSFAEDVRQRLSALRLLQLQSRFWNGDEKQRLTLGGGFEEHYTTNGALESGGSSDWYEAASVSLSSNREIARGWRLGAGADVGGFRYVKNPDLGTSYVDTWGRVTHDFQWARAEGSYTLAITQEWTQFKNYSPSGASTQILLGANAEWELFPNHTLSLAPTLSATPYSFPMNAGYGSCGTLVTYNWGFRKDWNASIYYNGYLTSYFNRQNDFTQYAGLSIAWSPRKNITLSASLSKTWNTSTAPESRYSALDLGGMLGLEWQL